MDTQDRAGSGMNDSGTGEQIGSPLTQHRSGFDLENTRRLLIARRTREGANSKDGHTCSNLVEQIDNLPGYVRPAWAVDERQTLPWMIDRQMKRLAPRAA